MYQTILDMNLVQSTNSNLNLSIDTENLTKCDGVKIQTRTGSFAELSHNALSVYVDPDLDDLGAFGS